MQRRKVYMQLKVTVPYAMLNEFHEYWGREALPVWIEHGVRHIGSFTNYIGDPVNEIIRLFEFDNIEHFEEWHRWLTESDQGRALMKVNSRFIAKMERKLWLSVY